MPLGRAIKAHGVRGELRIALELDAAAELIREGLSLRARLRTGETRTITIGEQQRRIHNAMLVTVRELPEREDVQTLAGAILEIDGAGLELDEDPYLFELEGATVEDDSGSALGTVLQIADNSGQELLVFRTGDGQERMLPLVDDTFIRFDRDRNALVIKPIPGLWDEES